MYGLGLGGKGLGSPSALYPLVFLGRGERMAVAETQVIVCKRGGDLFLEELSFLG